MSTSSNDEEHYYYQSSDPHTAVPDWVPFCSQISAAARNLITATLILQKRGQPPTRRELASSLDVDERSIYGWLQEIGAAGALSSRAAGRRRLIIFHNPAARGIPDPRITDPRITDPRITDPRITDPRITDPRITDPRIRYRPVDSCENPATESDKTAIPDQTISDRPVGVVVVQHDPDSDPTTANRVPLKTPLARWMKQHGINAAREFDDDSLDYSTYVSFIQDKLQLGWDKRQIVSTLRDAPLEPATTMTPVIYDEPADELAGELADELAQIAARRKLLLEELTADVNQRPASYHGVRR